MTTKITPAEEAALPDYTQISQINNAEFRVNEVKPEREMFWIETPKDKLHICILVPHISPDSHVGQQLRELDEADFVTLSAIRLEKDEDHLPWWYLTAIHNLRKATGTEQNAFGLR